MAKRDIITDVNVLHQKSKPYLIDKTLDGDTAEILCDLCDSVIPRGDLGLAAPQIGIFERVFIARLSSGWHTFVNPSVTKLGRDTIPSVEGCLSLPGISRCVERVARVEINADEIRRCDIQPDAPTFDEDGHLYPSDIITFSVKLNGPMVLTQLDACIVQHENDHLDGILLTDLPVTLTREERAQVRQADRAKKLRAKRIARKSQKPQPLAGKKHLSKHERIQAKKAARKQRQRELKKIAAFEEKLAALQGLFDPKQSKQSENTDQGTSTAEANTSLA